MYHIRNSDVPRKLTHVRVQQHFLITNYLIQIWLTRRKSSLGAQQHVVIQEGDVVVPVPSVAVAINTEIIGVASTVKACDAREIQSHLAQSAALAQHTSGFHDVVQREDFPEIQVTILVAVQTIEKVVVCPVVATLPEELDEFMEAHSPIPIRIH